ncbi:glycosyltransferase family 4 protein [Scytonema millei VB511283]|uniref:Glycosyltransferase family 4 protein n=2 Tax=Scytonema TaxID=1203 RepID=A0A9X5I6V4_9CYAN|nr:glycosyltransferase family 4 protein [Scytonema millei VB511283]
MNKFDAEIIRKILKRIAYKFTFFTFKIFKTQTYKYSYCVSYTDFLIDKYFSKSSRECYDLVFVIFEESKGWILEAICKEIATYFKGKYCFHYSPSSLPLSKGYFFAHYSFYVACLKLNPCLWGSKSLIFYTHPKGIMNNEEFVYAMNCSTKVISMCSQFATQMLKDGVKPEKVSFIIGGGADPKIFRSHQRMNGAIGFCTAYYARKDPDRIFNIIKMLPHREFILLGRDWDRYEKFTELTAMPNFSYIEASYTEYPSYYTQMDVFVSAAILEGGPIPLIEAMMCNVVPVASKTGFAPDIINHGKNGFLFDVDASAESVCKLIEQAYQIETDIRKTVEHLTWNNFSLAVQQLLEK